MKGWFKKKKKPQQSSQIVRPIKKPKRAKTKIINQPSSPIVFSKKRANYSQKKTKISPKKTEKKFKFFQLIKQWLVSGRGLIIIVSFILLVGLIYGLFMSNYFKVQEVVIDGVELLSQDELQIKVNERLEGWFWQVWQGNFWLTSSRRLCQSLDQYSLADCRLLRRWPNRFILKITEEPTVAIWQEGNRYYWTDQFGRITYQEPINPESANRFPIVINTGNNLVDNDRVMITLELWSLIAEIKQSDWPTERPQVYQFNSQEPSSLEALVDGQQIIKLTWRRSLADQLGLWQAGRGKFLKELDEAQIIDLRYGDRLIYQ